MILFVGSEVADIGIPDSLSNLSIKLLRLFEIVEATSLSSLKWNGFKPCNESNECLYDNSEF